MYFHEIAQELKLHMDPDGRAGEFVKRLVRDSLRDPMNEEEQEAEWLHEYNPMEKNISINMLDQIFEGDKNKWISKDRAGRICSLYDGIDLADQVDRLYDGAKEHLQKFLWKKGVDVKTEELGSAVQDIFDQIYHGLAKGIHDVDITLTIHEPRPSIKNLAGDRIYCEDGKLYIDGDVIELPIRLSDAQIGNLLQIVKATGNAFIAIRVEGIHVDAGSAVYAGVDFSAIDDRVAVGIHDSRRIGGVGIDEVGIGISLIIGTFQISVTEWCLQDGKGRNGFAVSFKLALTFLICCLDGGLDLFNCLLIRLRDDQTDAVLRSAAVDGLRLKDVGIAPASGRSCDNFGRIHDLRHIIFPLFHFYRLNQCL